MKRVSFEVSDETWWNAQNLAILAGEHPLNFLARIVREEVKRLDRARKDAKQ